jgi:oxygen-independent coproporphyrinogen III oxidase
LEALLPKDIDSLAMYEMAVHQLEEKGVKQYEISAFAKSDCYSRHNIGYWMARPFLGLGPSAFSYWDHCRFRNVANLSRYCKALQSGQSPVDFSEQLSPEQRVRELLAIQLRLIAGVPLHDFQMQHGQIDTQTLAIIESLIANGLLTQENERLKLTRKGILFYDSIASEII